MKLFVALALRSLGRNVRRSTLALSAITFAVWSSVVLAALARGMSEGMVRDALATLPGEIQIHHPEYLDDPVLNNRFPFSKEIALVLEQEPKLTSITPRLRIPAIVMSERSQRAVTLLGIIPAKEEQVSFYGTAKVIGQKLNNPQDKTVFVGKALLDKLESGVGKRLVLLTQDVAGGLAERGYVISGAYRAELEATELSFLFTGQESLQDLLGISTDEITELALGVQENTQLSPLVDRLQAHFPALSVLPWQELRPLVEALQRIQGSFLYLWFLIVVVAVSFGLVNSLFMAIFERQKEIALLRVLGMQRRYIVLQIVLESLVLLAVGVALGIVVSVATLWFLREGIDISAFSAGAASFGLGSVITPHLLGIDLLVASLLVFVVGVLSSLYPAWKAARQEG